MREIAFRLEISIAIYILGELIMRIVFLAPASNYHTNKWATFFVSRGYDVHVVSLTQGEIPGATIHTIDNSTDVNDNDLKKLSYLTKGREIRRIIDTISPDLVSVHYATSYGTLAALAGLKKYSLSVWGTDIYRFPQKSIFHKILLEFSLKKATLLLSTSKAMAQEAAKYTKKKFEITPFGVDINRFTPRNRSRNDRSFVIGTIKSLSPEYGIELILEAAKRVLKKRPDIQLQVRIAGNGPSEDNYHRLADELGISQNVCWLGFISQEQAAKEWANFDVAVIPSYRESFGVSALEAQASGIPLIITDVDGLKEATVPGKTCIVVNPGHADEIADSLIRIYEDRVLADRIGCAGREFVKSTFEYEKCFLHIEEVLVRNLS